jgi:uncharacterized protein
MADLAELSRSYGDFYAPAFSIKVNGKDLVEAHGVPVTQVEADRALGTMGRFSFTVSNSYDIKRHAFFTESGGQLLDVLAFGASVEVAMGYKGSAPVSTLLCGMITEISTTFPDGGVPELQVSGYDYLFPLTLGRRSDSYKDRTDSEVVSQLANGSRLHTAVVSTVERHAQIEQNQESDFDLLKKLAERNHFEFYVDAQSTLHFGKPNDRGDAIVTLGWGDGLLSFRPDANLAAQVSAVVVYGWDKDRKQAVVGRAQAGEESGRDSRRQSGGQQLSSAVGRTPALEVRLPVFTESEARQRAHAILNDHAKHFLTGEAECIGLPELQPDRSVTFGGLGAPFSKTYYIQQTVHKVDDNGYRTRVKVKETSL